MYEYISGKLVQLTPTYAVIDNHGIGYTINISLQTYSLISGKAECLLYIHQAIREDAHVFFGFGEKSEREIFRLLISVSGIGATTARMILSSLSPPEIESAILGSNVGLLKSVKGIGIKTAQRIIVDLKDKVGKAGEGEAFIISPSGTIKSEAVMALVNLGFSKNSVEKVIEKILAENNKLPVEELIKESLKRL